MKKILVSLLVLLALPMLSRANGDPVISYSAEIRSANPVPLKVADVQVVREDLTIKVLVPYTHVKVSYRLRNGSAKLIQVDYGFPVDFSGKIDDAPGFEGNEWSESIDEVGIAGRAVRNVHFRLDGAELKWTNSDEVLREELEYEDEDTGEKTVLEKCRLWTYTKLSLPAGQTVTLDVEYDILCNWSTGYYMMKASPLSRYFPSSGDFNYDFSPAQHWGNGKADEAVITLDASGLPANYFGDSSPSFYSNEATPFTRNGKVWTCRQKNFDFAKAENIAFSFWHYDNEHARETAWGDPLNFCAVPASAFQLKTSNAQNNYPAANMTDGNPATAWVATGNGVGAVIDIDFPKACRVSDLALLNGYHKSASLWSANSQIKKVRVEITRADGFKEEPMEVDLTDWDEFTYTLFDGSSRFGEYTFISLTNIDRYYFGRLIPDPEIEYAYIREKRPEGSDNIKHIRMTVLEVVPGTKYQDLCVSDILLLDGFKVK